MIRIYLDDVRVPSEDWDLHFYDGESLLRYLEEKCPKEVVLSLDHDLGLETLLSGYDVISEIERWIYEGRWNPSIFHIQCHSANPIGRQRILVAAQRIVEMLQKSDQS